MKQDRKWIAEVRKEEGMLSQQGAYCMGYHDTGNMLLHVCQSSIECMTPRGNLTINLEFHCSAVWKCHSCGNKDHMNFSQFGCELKAVL